MALKASDLEVKTGLEAGAASAVAAAEVDLSHTAVVAAAEVDLSHPAVVADSREGATAKQNAIDFNDPGMAEAEAVAANLAQ